VQSPPIDVNYAVANFELGFALGTIAMMTEGEPTNVGIGRQGELDAQKLLANAGIDTERGWQAYSEGAHAVQLDLVDLEGQQFFETKVGPRGAWDPITRAQIRRQGALLKGPVDLRNSYTRETYSDFTFKSGTWLDLKNSAGLGGFSDHLKKYLSKNTLDWAYLWKLWGSPLTPGDES